MTLDVLFLPVLPWPLLAGLGLLVAVLLAVAAWRRTPGTALRAVVGASVLFLLAGPHLRQETREPLDAVVLLAVDRSPSQELGDRPARTAAAVAAVRDRLARLPGFELREVELDRATAAAAGRSALVGVVEQALADVPHARRAGVLLVTDGQVHDVPAVVPGGLPPVHLLLTGDKGERDRRLRIVEAPAYATVGGPAVVRIRVEDTQPGPATATVELRTDAGETRRLTVPVGRDVPVEVRIPHAGRNTLAFQVEPLPGQITELNDTVAAVVSGVRERLKVLLVSGEPHAGSRTWRNVLKADPAIELVHFTILRPMEKNDGTPTNELSLIGFPVQELFEQKLKDFDLVVFDRFRRRTLLPDNYLANVARYVETGGALLEAGGPAYADPLGLAGSSLARVVPARPTGEILEEAFVPRLSDRGRRHPVAAGLERPGQPPWSPWFRQMGVGEAKGVTLMDGNPGQPLLVLDRVGEGRVAQLTSDEIWLWTRGIDGGGPSQELLRRLIHWLMKEPDLEEEALSAHIDAGRLIIERRSLEPGSVEATVTMPSGRVERTALRDGQDGVARGAVAAPEPGLHRVSDGRRETLAVSGAGTPQEFLDVRTTAERLSPLVSATDGGTWWLAEATPELRRVRPGRDTAGGGWAGLVDPGAESVSGRTEAPLVPPLAGLLFLLGALLWAWRREGR